MKKTETGKRPTDGKPKFETEAEFNRAADAYFRKCDEDGVLYGEAGLALGLGVTLRTLESWYNGERRAEDLQEAVQMAYLRIQNQIETDPRYQEKGMVTRSIFLNKQPKFGGYQDRIAAQQDISVNVKMGDGMDASDFK